MSKHRPASEIDNPYENDYKINLMPRWASFFLYVVLPAVTTVTAVWANIGSTYFLAFVVHCALAFTLFFEGKVWTLRKRVRAEAMAIADKTAATIKVGRL